MKLKKHRRLTLKELLFKIDLKRDFGEYTMTELQKITEKEIRVINKYNPESESINDLKESISDATEPYSG